MMVSMMCDGPVGYGCPGYSNSVLFYKKTFSLKKFCVKLSLYGSNCTKSFNTKHLSHKSSCQGRASAMCEKMYCYVRGYHMYKESWRAVVSKVLICTRELSNVADRCTIAVVKKETVIVQLPQESSKCALYFCPEKA